MVKIYGHSSDLTSSGVNKFYPLSTARPKKKPVDACDVCIDVEE